MKDRVGDELLSPTTPTVSVDSIWECRSRIVSFFSRVHWMSYPCWKQISRDSPWMSYVKCCGNAMIWRRNCWKSRKNCDCSKNSKNIDLRRESDSQTDMPFVERRKTMMTTMERWKVRFHWNPTRNSTAINVTNPKFDSCKLIPSSLLHSSITRNDSYFCTSFTDVSSVCIVRCLSVWISVSASPLLLVSQSPRIGKLSIWQRVHAIPCTVRDVRSACPPITLKFLHSSDSKIDACFVCLQICLYHPEASSRRVRVQKSFD